MQKILKKSSTPVIAQGGITNLYTAQNLISENFSDFVGFAQSLIADPKMIIKTLTGNEKKNNTMCSTSKSWILS